MLVYAQESTGQNKAGSLRVFLDCNHHLCDRDFLRTEITFVNWVRDRHAAQVHILVTFQITGGGGIEYTFSFIGLEEFEGEESELRYVSNQTNTDDERRRGVAKTIAVGLLPYLVGTPVFDQVELTHRPTETSPPIMARPEDDPWNFWVFRTRLSAEFEGEEQRKKREFEGSFSANRTTEAWKLRFAFNGEYRERRYDLNEASIVSSISHNNSLIVLAVKSIGEHVGAAFQTSATSSTFVNQDIAIRIAPGFEYNFFPYSESTRRQFTLRYEVGFNQFDYEQTTLFGKDKESLWDESLRASFDINEPWGDSGLTVEFSHYFYDFSKFRVVLNGDIDFRIFRGLSFNLRGSTSWIRDQLFLPAKGSNIEEILLEQHVLATDSRYRISFGITYTFGSIYSNVVNARFAGSNGGFSRFF